MASFGRNPQGSRWLPLALAAVAWIGLVVVGAGTRSEDPLLGVDNVEIVWTIALGVAVVLSLIFLIILRPREFEAGNEKRQNPGWIVLLLCLAVLWWKPDLVRGLLYRPGQDQAEEEDEPLGPGVETERSDVETVAELTDILLVILAIGIALGVWWFARRRVEEVPTELEQAPHPVDEQFEQELVDTIDTLSLELRSGGDPRTAVMNAYAILEVVLGRRGFARTATETHAEHIRRALQSVRVDTEPFEQLASLYERARFSVQPIDRSEQDRAAQALETAQSMLAKPA